MHSESNNSKVPPSGILIINADDWGRNFETTDRIHECVLRKAVSSVSAMVFMEDSERAAAIAREQGIDTGLHLNFTAPFSAPGCPRNVAERQRELGSRLRRHRLAHIIYYPSLKRSFEYVTSAQIDEYCRLYGTRPRRIDGHHHMHLCTNVLATGLLPPGIIVRRSFSFGRGEKSWCNRMYRQAVDRILARRHHFTDFFYSITPLEPARLQRIFSLARHFAVEIETHPVNPEEHEFLTGGAIFRYAGDVPIERRYAVRAASEGQPAITHCR